MNSHLISASLPARTSTFFLRFDRWQHRHKPDIQEDVHSQNVQTADSVLVVHKNTEIVSVTSLQNSCCEIWHLLSSNDMCFSLHLNNVSTLPCDLKKICYRCEWLWNQSNTVFTLCVFTMYEINKQP